MNSKNVVPSSKLVKYQIIFLLTAIAVKMLISVTNFLTGELRLEVFQQFNSYAWHSKPITESTFALHNYLTPIIATSFAILNIGILIYAVILFFRKYLKSYAIIGIILIGLCMIVSYIISHIPSNLVYNEDFGWRDIGNVSSCNPYLYTPLGEKLQSVKVLLNYIPILGAIIILYATSLKKSIKWILSVGWIIGLILSFFLSYIIEYVYGPEIFMRYQYIYSHLYTVFLFTIALIILICVYLVNKHRDAKTSESASYRL